MTEQLNLDSDPNQGSPRPTLAKEGSPRNQEVAGSIAQPEDSGPASLNLADYFRVLHKRRWTAISAFLIVLTSVIVYTFSATPIYEAQTRILIQSDEQNVVSFRQVVEEDQANQDYYQTQYNILQSRALARKTLDALKLWQHPLFAESSGESRNWVMSLLRAPMTLIASSGENAPAGENAIPGADETASQSQAIDQFLDGLTIAPVRNSRLVDITYRSPDAALAATIANTLAKNYIEQNLEYKFLASKEASDWLGERLAEQRKQVEQAEIGLQRYREQNDAIAMEDRENIVVQKLSDLNAAVTRAKTERIQKEALYQQLQASQSDPARLDTFPAILGNSFIQQQKGELSELQRQYAQLSERLADKHPEIIRIKSAIQQSQNKLNSEIAKVVQSVRSEYQAALAQENSLAGALQQQKAEALSMNRKAIDYGVLERDLESSKQMYQSLLQRAKETGISGELKTSNIRIVDIAETPRTPVTPQKTLSFLFAVFGGGLLACGLVFLFEYLDSRIKTPDEVRRHLGLSHLGLLPVVESGAVGGNYPLLHNAVPPNFGEAFRGIRTNVLFSSAEEGCRSVVVTSTAPGEGKSVVAANLAVSLAQAGARVLLIDGDLRRPKVHEIFDTPQEPGLSNLLVGSAKASEATRKTVVSGLWVLAAGHIPPNPAELVGSQRFRDFLSSLRAHFDWIIVDSPPVMAVTDAALMAHHSSGVVFVVGAEMTSRHAAKRAIDQLHQAKAHFLGAVLNRVDLQHNSYYYSHYYRREYSNYYAKQGSSV